MRDDAAINKLYKFLTKKVFFLVNNNNYYLGLFSGTYIGGIRILRIVGLCACGFAWDFIYDPATISNGSLSGTLPI